MIVLMRHAQVDCGHGRCIGRTDIPLTSEGREQALAMAETLSSIGLARLCSSPARRALDAVVPLAGVLGRNVDVLPALAEIDMGAWDGLSFEDIRARFPEEYAERGRRFGEFRPPGGENFNDVAGRAMEALSELAGGVRPVLVATHAGVIRAVLCRLTGHPMDDLFHFKPDHLGCTLIRPARSGLELVADGVRPEDLAPFI